jgi:hypothetical protein
MDKLYRFIVTIKSEKVKFNFWLFKIIETEYTTVQFDVEEEKLEHAKQSILSMSAVTDWDYKEIYNV